MRALCSFDTPSRFWYSHRLAEDAQGCDPNVGFDPVSDAYAKCLGFYCSSAEKAAHFNAFVDDVLSWRVAGLTAMTAWSSESPAQGCGNSQAEPVVTRESEASGDGSRLPPSFSQSWRSAVCAFFSLPFLRRSHEAKAAPPQAANNMTQRRWIFMTTSIQSNVRSLRGCCHRVGALAYIVGRPARFVAGH